VNRLRNRLRTSTAGTFTPPPPPASADFLVTNDAEFATANTNATAGQIIQLQDSGTFTALTLTNATGVTVRGQTSQVPVLRSLTINGAQNATVTGLKIQANSVPSLSPKLIDLRGNLSGLVIENCYIRGGNPWNSFSDFDVTTTDTSRMGTNGAWSATNPYSEELWYGIGAAGSGANAPSGSFTIRNNTVLDVASGIKFGLGNTAPINAKINGNRVGRCYTDLISMIIGSTTGVINGLEVCGNELFDSFSQSEDNLNPHSDAIQITIVSAYTNPIPNILIAGNIYWHTPGGRGSAQRIFTNGYYAGYPLVAPIIVDNVFLSRMSSHGITLESGSPEGVAWGYIRRNIMLANPVNNVTNNNESYTNTLTGSGPSVPLAASIGVSNSASYGNAPNYIALNTSEAFQAYSTDRLVGNITTTGPATTATAYQTWLDTDTIGEWSAVTSADTALAAMTAKTAYAANRPMTVGESADTFRSRWSVAANRPWSSMPSWTDWVDLTGVTVSTVQTSEWAYVHAGQPGVDSRAISISGGEYRIADDRAGTNATAWTSTAGTITSGKYLQVRQTASGSGSASTTLTVTIGSESMDWTVTTASSASYPIVSLEGTTPDLFSIGSSTNLGSDAYVGTIAIMRFKMASAPAATVNFFGPSSSAGNVQVSIRTSGRVRVELYGPTSALMGRFETAVSVCDGSYHDILFSWDTSDTNTTTGQSCYLDGSANGANVSWPASPTLVGYSVSKNAYRFGVPVAGTMEVGAFYLNTVARVDLTVAGNRAKFNADQIGSDGSGPTGSQPIHFLVGTVGQSGGWNDAGGINRGSGAKFIKVGSAAAVDVSGSTWV